MRERGEARIKKGHCSTIGLRALKRVAFYHEEMQSSTQRADVQTWVRTHGKGGSASAKFRGSGAGLRGLLRRPARHLFFLWPDVPLVAAGHG